MINNPQIYTTGDTICAISTAPGVGGIAVARVSGPNAIDITQKIWRGVNLNNVKSHTAHLGIVLDCDGSDLDQAVATIFRGPNSFTGEDVVEISVHGSRWIQQRLIDSLNHNGARLALPGEFTRRAFASGKLDLAQAEAVADMIASSSKSAHRLAISQMRGEYSKKIDSMRAELVNLASLLELELDFSEEEVEFASRSRLLELSEQLSAQLQAAADSFRTGRAIKDGVPVALVGATNAGKSSLLNALVSDDRAIVSDIHGTTRDVVEDAVEIGDYLIRFKDTAGIRLTDDPIEKLGIQRSIKAAETASIVIYVIDSSSKIEASELLPDADIIVAANKIDLVEPDQDAIKQAFPNATIVQISAKNGEGIDTLRKAITDILDRRSDATDITVANIRHAEAFIEAANSLRAFAQALKDEIPSDLAAQDLRQAIYSLSSVTGQITTPELLQNIFANFCIGK